MTDALDMKGVLQDPNINVDLRAFEVGNDIILMSTNVSEGINLIAERLRKGKISMGRLSNSVKKILSLKVLTITLVVVLSCGLNAASLPKKLYSN